MKRRVLLALGFLAGASFPAFLVWVNGQDLPTTRGGLMGSLVIMGLACGLCGAALVNMLRPENP